MFIGDDKTLGMQKDKGGRKLHNGRLEAQNFASLGGIPF
jgi:hypothetical protein